MQPHFRDNLSYYFMLMADIPTMVKRDIFREANSWSNDIVELMKAVFINFSAGKRYALLSFGGDGVKGERSGCRPG